MYPSSYGHVRNRRKPSKLHDVIRECLLPGMPAIKSYPGAATAIEWNLTTLGGPAHGIVIKTVQGWWVGSRGVGVSRCHWIDMLPVNTIFFSQLNRSIYQVAEPGFPIREAPTYCFDYFFHTLHEIQKKNDQRETCPWRQSLDPP